MRRSRRGGRALRGPLLPASDAPLIVERRYHLDVALRTALLRGGSTAQLLRFAGVHPSDVEVLQRAVAVAAIDDPDLPAAVAALAVAIAVTRESPVPVGSCPRAGCGAAAPLGRSPIGGGQAAGVRLTSCPRRRRALTWRRVSAAVSRWSK